MEMGDQNIEEMLQTLEKVFIELFLKNLMLI